jgi:hypothetical protein
MLLGRSFGATNANNLFFIHHRIRVTKFEADVYINVTVNFYKLETIPFNLIFLLSSLFGIRKERKQILPSVAFLITTSE